MKFTWKNRDNGVFEEADIQKLLELLSSQFEKAYIIGDKNSNGDPLVITTVFQWANPHDYCEFNFEPNCSEFTVCRPPVLMENGKRVESLLRSAGYV